MSAAPRFAKGDGRDEDRRKGGRVRAARARSKAPVRVVPPDELPGALETLDDAVRWASWLTAAIGSGRVDSKTGDVMFRGLRVFTDGRAKLDRVDERVKRLQEQISTLRKSMENGR
jgi:hypothetical protein